MLGARKVKTQKAAIIFEPQQAAGFFGGLAGAVNGDLVHKKSSFLARLLGKRIASGQVTLADDATLSGGLATRLDVTYDDLDDLQVGIEALLALRDDADELVVSLSAADGVLHASLGPFPPEKVHAADSDRGLDLRRVLETVCDTHEVDERDGGAWVELTKRIANAEPVA